ncbi:MAG TPA: hypothetical protein VIH57_25455 [Bacteroidales bacterium]
MILILILGNTDIYLSHECELQLDESINSFHELTPLRVSSFVALFFEKPNENTSKAPGNGCEVNKNKCKPDIYSC